MSILLYPLILIILPTILIMLLITGIYVAITKRLPALYSKLYVAHVKEESKDHLIVEILKTSERVELHFFPTDLHKGDFLIVTTLIEESTIPRKLRPSIQDKYFYRQNGQKKKLKVIDWGAHSRFT